MTVEYELNPDQSRGTGTAFIAWEADGHGYLGYWDRLPDGPPAPLEEMPRTHSLKNAVEWGRERTPHVLIRPASDPGEYYWAGVGDPHGELANLPRIVL